MVEVVCDKCGQTFRCGPANTMLTRYPYASHLDWMASTCPYQNDQGGRCGDVMLNFISESVADFLMEQGCPTTILAEIDEEIVKQWCQTKGVEPLKEHELDEHEQHYVQFLHWLLFEAPEIVRVNYINQLWR